MEQKNDLSSAKDTKSAAMMRVFTIVRGEVEEGAVVGKFVLKGAGVEIPAIIVGEEGRGRQLGILPVQLTNSQYKDWQEKSYVRIEFASLGMSRTSKPKLFAGDSANSDEKIICVFRTHIGFRGGNNHTGDHEGEETFLLFPGDVLTRGVIAQGAAGRMGSGDQLVAVMPKDKVFRTAYSGRLYGQPNAHYFKWYGKKLLGVTRDERIAVDLF